MEDAEDPSPLRRHEAHSWILEILGHETPEETEIRGQWVVGLQITDLRFKITCDFP